MGRPMKRDSEKVTMNWIVSVSSSAVPCMNVNRNNY